MERFELRRYFLLAALGACAAVAFAFVTRLAILGAAAALMLGLGCYGILYVDIALHGGRGRLWWVLAGSFLGSVSAAAAIPAWQQAAGAERDASGAPVSLMVFAISATVLTVAGFGAVIFLVVAAAVSAHRERPTFSDDDQDF